jgi:hypothetical protein
MPRIYEVPTHLNVEDTLLLGLTPRQLVRLAAFTSLAYGLWDQVTVIPPIPRILAAGLLALIGALVALVQPGGRALDQWAFAGLAYALSPRRFTWRPPEPETAAWRMLDGTGWVEFAPALGWGEAGTAEALEDEDDDPAPAGRRLRLPWTHP